MIQKLYTHYTRLWENVRLSKLGVPKRQASTTTTTSSITDNFLKELQKLVEAYTVTKHEDDLTEHPTDPEN